MTRAAAVAVALLAAAGARAEGRSGDELTILWTGETHAMLSPCVCPLRPEGGVARRAAVVAALRAEGPIVLVDAGGWAAGGIYDEYTEGPEVDRIRSAAAARAAAAMGCDAVAVSDEELLDGGALVRDLIAKNALPLVSANLVEKASGRRVAPAFVVVERGGWSVGIVGLTTTELDLLAPEAARRYSAGPPVEAARRAVGEARAVGAEVVVLLSPLGEELTEEVAREVNGIDLAVNAHRRLTSSEHFRAGGAVVAQFEFQGRAIGRATAARMDGRVRVEVREQVRLGPEVKEDGQSPAARVVRQAEEAIAADSKRRKLTIELFKMALCPYTPETEKVVAEVARSIEGRLEVRVTHLVRLDARGRLSSLHGPAEVDEALRQAAVFEFYRDAYWDYVQWRAKNPTDTDWQSACRRFRISPARVRACIASGEADEMLRRQARRAERMRVSGSPTLYLGGRRYEGPGERLAILRAVCSTLPAGARGAAVCRGLPACFSDADCRKPGVVAECVEAGTARAKCVEHPAVQVALTVVEDGDAVWSARARIVDSLRVFFPGLVERRVDFRGPEGAALAERFGIERLPAYVLGPEALTERNIEAVRTALVPVAGSLVLAPGLAGSHQDATRPRQPGRVDLFLAPHSTQAAEALGEALDFAERGASCPIGLRAAVWRDAEGRLAAQGGLAEIESMLREIAVSELWPARSAAYRRACLGRIGTSYWLDAVVEAGLDPDAVRRAAESSLAYALLEADAQELAELGAGGAVVLLVSNQELVPAASRLDLRRALDAALDLAGRQGPAPDGEPSEDARPGADSPPCFSSERAGRAVPLLVRALEAAPEPARARIAQGLAALTREAFGTDASRWRKWARERKLGR